MKIWLEIRVYLVNYLVGGISKCRYSALNVVGIIWNNWIIILGVLLKIVNVSLMFVGCLLFRKGPIP